MKKSKNKTVLILISLIVVGSGIGYALYTQKFKADDGTQNLSLFTARQGPLTISVIEAATIKARYVEIIKSEVEGNTTVLWVIEEATKVKKGDKLIELDASELKDDRDKQVIVVLNSKTASDIAVKTLDVAKSKSESDIAQAKLTLDLAIMDLNKYVDKGGEYETQLTESTEKIKIAEKERMRTLEKYEGSKIHFGEKYISRTELKSDEIAWNKAQLDLMLQKSQLKLFKDYTDNRTRAELDNNVKQAKMSLNRVQIMAGADIFKAQEQLKATRFKYEREKGILDKLIQQIGKATIYAPNAGTVIYASSTKASWRSNDAPLSEGESVHEREELFHLPKADLVSAVANIHEANLNKVKLGSPVSIKVDAIPGEIFTGVVGKIAMMPDARMVYINPNLKVYKTEMYIDEKPGFDTGKLRTGMGCQVEVISAYYEDAVYVPIQAVITVGSQPTIYVYENRKINPRNVEIGKDNNRMVHIISGLKKGEQVLLTPPLSKAEVKDNRKRGKGKPGQGNKPGGMDKPQGAGAKRPGGDSNGSGAGRGNGGGSNRPPDGKRPPQSGGPKGPRN